MSTTLGKIDSFASKRKTVLTEEIPELGGSFRIRMLSYGESQSVESDDPNRLFKLMALAIVDDQGQQLYTSEEDIQNLAGMGVDVFKVVMDAVNGINGITGKAAEDTAKKSEASRTLDSASV